MKTIKYKNGFFFLNGFELDDMPDWVTDDYRGSDPYFLLNKITRQKFARDFLPLVKQGEVHITKEDFDRIKHYPRSFYDINGVQAIRITEPKGITLEPHQRKSVRIMQQNKRFGFFLGTGTGKTLIAISHIMNRSVRKAIIFTPKKVIDQYVVECQTYLKNYLITTDVKEMLQSKDPSILVINYQQLHNILKQDSLRGQIIDLLVLDESHNAKELMSKANQQLRELAIRADRIYLFTGTPMDKSRHEIFPQLAILNTDYMPQKSRFLHRYFHLDDYYQPKSEKRHLSAELTSMIEEITWGGDTDKLIDLTKEHHNIVEITKIPEEYKVLQDKRVIIKQNVKEPKITWECIADTKGILKQKLRQVCGGTLIGEVIDRRDPENVKKLKEISFHLKNNGKEEALKKLLKKLSTGIIYTAFKQEIVVISKVMREVGVSFRAVDGSTKDSGPLIEDFKRGRVKFLVMQSRSGNAGLDLTTTNNVVFYTLHDSYPVVHQCRSRVRRIGQKKELNYYYLVCKNTVDEQIYAALKKKKSFSTKLFKIYN